jgi:hypothetical protein
MVSVADKAAGKPSASISDGIDRRELARCE